MIIHTKNSTPIYHHKECLPSQLNIKNRKVKQDPTNVNLCDLLESVSMITVWLYKTEGLSPYLCKNVF